MLCDWIYLMTWQIWFLRDDSFYMAIDGQASVAAHGVGLHFDIRVCASARTHQMDRRCLLGCIQLGSVQFGWFGRSANATKIEWYLVFSIMDDLGKNKNWDNHNYDNMCICGDADCDTLEWATSMVSYRAANVPSSWIIVSSIADIWICVFGFLSFLFLHDLAINAWLMVITEFNWGYGFFLKHTRLV